MDFKERYRYDPAKDLVGKGGFSKVYRAYDVMLQREVALKFLFADSSDKYDLLSEIRRVIQFHHTNVIQYFDIQTISAPSIHGSIEQVNVIIMEFINSGNLYNFLKSKPAERELKEVILGILRGLQFIHGKKIIHRDIKPQNIFMNREGGNGKWVPKVADFGISKTIDVQEAASSALMGTVEYMAPEQFNAIKYGVRGGISTNVDLWSFGVILYEIFTGEPFFGRRSTGVPLESVMSNILEKRVPEVFPNVKEPYESIIRHCLVKDAELRAQDAGELIDIIERGGQSGPPPRKPSFTEGKKPSGTRTHLPPIVKKPEPQADEYEYEEEKRGIRPWVWITPLLFVLLGGIGFGAYQFLLKEAQQNQQQVPENTTENSQLGNEAEEKEVHGQTEVDKSAEIDERKFREYLNLADSNYTVKSYNNARIYYEKAGELKPDDSYVRTRLDIIEVLNENQGKTIIPEIKSEQSDLDEMAFQSAKIAGTLEALRNYVVLYPNGKHAEVVNQHIKEGERIEALNKYIQEGDDLKGQGKYDDAIEKYDEAFKLAATRDKRMAIQDKIADCTQKLEEEKIKTEIKVETKKEVREETKQQKIVISDHQLKFELLLRPEKKGVVRGLNFGMDNNEVRNTEKANGLDVSANSVLFNLTTDGRETAKISYKYSGNLTQVVIETFQTKNSEELYKKIEDYLNTVVSKKAGTPEGDAIIWGNLKDKQANKNYEISLEDKGGTGIKLFCYLPQ